MLMLGGDRGLPVCADYDPPFAWTGALYEIVLETGPAIPRALADEARALLHHE
jgi:arylsulfatase